MNQISFKGLVDQLNEAGYSKWNNCYNHADYYYCKAFHKDDNPWDEGRSGYQILLYVYDWSRRDLPGLDPAMLERVGIDIVITVSRTSDELIDLKLIWSDHTTIKEIENAAEEFYTWVSIMWPIPREC